MEATEGSMTHRYSETPPPSVTCLDAPPVAPAASMHPPADPSSAAAVATAWADGGRAGRDALTQARETITRQNQVIAALAGALRSTYHALSRPTVPGWPGLPDEWEAEELGRNTVALADGLRKDWEHASAALAQVTTPDRAEGANTQPVSAALPSGGQFMRISFLGHDEVTGYVTDVTVGGEPGFRIDKPDKLWGGNPNAWEEWAGKALRMREPLTEESVRAEWEARRAAEERRRQQQAEWERQQAQRALPAGDDGPWDGEDEPGFDHMRDQR